MTVKLQTERHLEFLSITGGCTGSCESTLVKMPHCWKSHVVAQISVINYLHACLLIFRAFVVKRSNFLQNCISFFKIKYSGTLSECRTVCVQIRIEVPSDPLNDIID